MPSLVNPDTLTFVLIVAGELDQLIVPVFPEATSLGTELDTLKTLFDDELKTSKPYSPPPPTSITKIDESVVSESLSVAVALYLKVVGLEGVVIVDDKVVLLLLLVGEGVVVGPPTCVQDIEEIDPSESDAVALKVT